MTITATDLEARAAWSVITEPSDDVAGSFVTALGHTDALSALGDPGACVTTLIEVGAASDKEQASSAVQRWVPRLSAGSVDFALQEASRHGISLLDPAAVPGLNDLGVHAPHVLWVRGDVDGATSPLDGKIALVGARANTSYGAHVTREITTELVSRGITVVSGAAYGIDAAAHRAALWNNGRTIAWLANGPDRSYPTGHRELIDRIAANPGCAVISEVPPGSFATRHRFLSRNRLIAASAGATVVVEAGWRSGSLTTSEQAATLGRGLGAVPGPITSVASAGCHRLIRDFQAQLVTSADEAFELLGR